MLRLSYTPTEQFGGATFQGSLLSALRVSLFSFFKAISSGIYPPLLLFFSLLLLFVCLVLGHRILLVLNCALDLISRLDCVQVREQLQLVELRLVLFKLLMRELEQALLQEAVFALPLHQGHNLVGPGHEAASKVATLDFHFLSNVSIDDWGGSDPIHALVEDGYLAGVAIRGDSSHDD